MYKIVRNFLSEDEKLFLENSILNAKTNWLFNRYNAYTDKAYGVSDEMKRNITSFRRPVFQNFIILDKEIYNTFKLIPQKLGYKNIYNMIAQLQLATVNEHKPIKHVDLPKHPTPYYSMVYYVNDSDGPTVLYHDDGSEMVRCEPERGSIIIFDGNIQHHASKPTRDIRCVMNFCVD